MTVAAAQDNAAKLINLLLAAEAAGIYDSATGGWTGPVIPESPLAFTLTYNTAAEVVPLATAAAVATTASALTAYGYTEAQADAIPVAINATQADVLALKKVVVALINVVIAAGLAT